MIRFIVLPGVPFAQKRAKVGTVEGHPHMYDPSKNDKALIRAQIMAKAPAMPVSDPVKLTMVFQFPRPNTHYGTGKNAGLLKDGAPSMHTSRPDLDNLEKIILDSMNKLYFRDDSQVCVVTKRKIYGESPKLEIIFETLTNEGESKNDER